MYIELTLLENIRRCIVNVNSSLDSYQDGLYNIGKHIGEFPEQYDDSVHFIQDLIQVITDLSLCAELAVKFRLSEEHWAFIFDEIHLAKKKDLEEGSFISVSLKRGKARLENLCEISISLENCMKLYELRNKIQHYAFREQLGYVLNLLSLAIDEIYNFVFAEVISYVNEDNLDDFNRILKKLKDYGIYLKEISKNSNIYKISTATYTSY